ncbi:MAG: S1 RNA-binding domain-containing protein [Planctomycetes bacterium]|nr:S1 RNA-binding domain-containing protein [Planctomycetota bacterium]
MVDQNLIREMDVSEEELDAVFGGSPAETDLDLLYADRFEVLKPGTILKGIIVGRAGDDIVVDVGLKSEGTISATEWDSSQSVEPGTKVDVWLETVESDSGLVVLSKRKADRLLNWQRIVETNSEGDTVRGRVMRKIKGGLLVDIGVPVFLPASQVDVRRPGDIGEFIGKDIDAKILKIDTERRNIVISRRKLIEVERQAAKEHLLAEIAVGQTRKGTVKNLADFGAFVDLGGIDGLLHITDMSWDRVGHPSDILRVDEEIEIKILNIDLEKEKIALGLKQLKENPWDTLEERFTPESRIKGEVVNITNYGAFVKLEPGVEGLVHISEMSWTRRINHPSEILSVGDIIDVVVLEVNKGKQEISLGIKQTEVNPWTQVAEKYPPNTRITGRVRNLTNYGAFVEVEEGIDGLLHVSDMSWTKKINHPSEVLKKGENIDCVVLKVEEQKQRIALGLKQIHEDPWLHAVPENYIPGQIVEGKVTKITNFGVFVELEQDLEGLLHISELADHKVEDPHDEVKVDDKIQVKILRVDPVDRKIGLSKKRAEWSAEQEAADPASTKRIKKRRGGLHGPDEEGVGYSPFVEMPTTSSPKGDADDAGSVAEPAPEAVSASDEVVEMTPVAESASPTEDKAAQPGDDVAGAGPAGDNEAPVADTAKTAGDDPEPSDAPAAAEDESASPSGDEEPKS